MMYSGNSKGYALVITTVILLLASLMSYLIMTHTSGVRGAGKYLKNSETTQLMLSLRNVLVEDAVEIGGLRNPDPNDSLPSYLMDLNYNPPVTDVWGSEIKYCVYSSIDQPARGLAGRLLSAGENRKLQTVCSDSVAKGDDITVDIFADSIAGNVIAPGRAWSPPVMFSANNASSYLVREDGTLWAWGANVGSALQDGTTINRRLPVQPKWSANANDFVSDVKKISAGKTSGFVMLREVSTVSEVWASVYSTTAAYPMQIPVNNAVHVQAAGVVASAGEPTNGLALRSDGTVWAWGGNAPSRVFIKAGALSAATSVSVSKTASSAVSGHALATRSDNTVWAWGLNTNGQLGNGTTTNSIIPVQVSGLSDVKAVSAGTSHSLALKLDGTVWAWGLNTNGRLGDNSTTQRPTPVQVRGFNNVGFLTGILAISAGASHSMALKSDGTVWAWGNNANGRLGDNSITQRTTPVQTKDPSDPSGNLTGVIAISAGASHSMALKSDGTVWAWGLNTNGQLGDNTTTQRLTPVQVKGTDGVDFLSGVASISAGGSHSMALKADGTVWAWGLNTYGRLGDGTTTQSLTPVQVLGEGGIDVLSGITAISAGGEHSMALKPDGTVWAWGRNNINYELGDETNTTSYIPVQAKRLAGATMIAAGGGNSFAIGPDSTLWTWGRGWPSIFIPAPIWGAGGEGVLTGITGLSVNWFSGSAYHALALKSDGSVLAWGLNGNGQLGNNSTTPNIYPVQVSGLSNVIAVSAGANHSMALKSDGTVWAWGLNSSGQLGNNSTTRSLVPVQVRGLNNVGFLAGIVTISAGTSHSLALKSDRTAWAWGLNSSGQLGDGTTTTPRRTPLLVSDLSGIKAISAGGNHSIAFRTDGTVWAWGLNGNGQLGTGAWINKTKPAPVLYVRHVIP